MVVSLRGYHAEAASEVRAVSHCAFGKENVLILVCRDLYSLSAQNWICYHRHRCGQLHPSMPGLPILIHPKQILLHLTCALPGEDLPPTPGPRCNEPLNAMCLAQLDGVPLKILGDVSPTTYLRLHICIGILIGNTKGTI